MTNWESIRLGDVLSIKHGFAFPGTAFSDDLQFPTLLTPGNFAVGGGFKAAKPKTFSEEISSDYILEPGDVVVTMTDLSRSGDTLGYSAIIPDDDREYLHNQRIGKIIILDEERADLKFVSYLMRGREYRHHVLAGASGSTVKHTSPSRIESFAAKIPQVEEQQRIAAVLASFDELIAINRQLSIDLAALQRWSFLEAWNGSLARLGDIAQITMGQSPPGDTFNEAGEGTVFYQGVRDFGWRFPSNRVWTTDPKRLAEAGDVLVAVRAPVGDSNLATERTCLGRGLAGVRALNRPSTLFAALTVDPAIWNIHQGTGTVFASINKKDMFELQIPWVDDDTLEAKLAIFGNAVYDLHVEIMDLTRARDELLPLLMSGKIRVDESLEVS